MEALYSLLIASPATATRHDEISPVTDALAELPRLSAGQGMLPVRRSLYLAALE